MFNVLLVDDSALLRNIVAKALALSGLDIETVLHAAEGAEALQQLNTHPVDLVFTDLHMPGVDGPSLIRFMHEDERFRHIPVIVISTDGSAARRDELEMYGVAAYLRKPFAPEKLRETVEQVVAHVCR